MKKIYKKEQLIKLNSYPSEIICIIESIITVLDENYGSDRKIDEEDGGYILIIESKEDFVKLKEIYINIDNVIPEYVDRIVVEYGTDWCNSLIIMNNDYTVSIFSKISITPQNLIDYIE